MTTTTGPTGTSRATTTTRLAHDAWREVLVTATDFMRQFELAGDFGDLTSREYDVLRALAEQAGPLGGGVVRGRSEEVVRAREAVPAEADAAAVDVSREGVSPEDGTAADVPREDGTAADVSAADVTPGTVGMRLGVLAEATYLPQPSMSRLVERLERRGLVRRARCAGDGRGTIVSLTDLGVARQREIGRRHVRSIVAAMTAGLGPEELAQLADSLRRLRAGAHGPDAADHVG